jgi:hypothetical protein
MKIHSLTIKNRTIEKISIDFINLTLEDLLPTELNRYDSN